MLAGTPHIIYETLNTGLRADLSRHEARRIKLVNGVNTLIFVLALPVALINLYYSYLHCLICFTAIFFLSLPVYLLNHHQKHGQARLYFGMALFISLVFAIIFAERDGEMENLMLAYSIISIVLYNRWVRYLTGLLALVSFLALKAWKFQVFGLSVEENQILILINSTLNFIVVYATAHLIIEALTRAEKHLEDSYEALYQQNHSIFLQKEGLKEQKQALQYQRHLLRSTLDALPLMVAMLDQEGRYIVVNERYAEALQLTRTSIEGRPYQEVLPPDLLQSQCLLLERGLQGENIVFEKKISCPNGAQFPAYGKYTPILNAQGQVQFLSVFLLDITVLKEKEEALEKLNQTKNRLFSIISHDLRNPISSILTLFRLAEQGDMSNQEIREFMPRMSQDLNATAHLLENLLSWARNQLGGEVISPEAFSIGVLLEENLALISKRAELKRIKLQTDTVDDLKVWADRVMIDLVVRNLLSNAVKFTPAGGNIQITYEMIDETELRVAICDSGVGISPENLEKIFKQEAFTTRGTAREKGTGLGLSLCWEYVRKNGGQLSVTSTPSQGSCFCFTIPISQAKRLLPVHQKALGKPST